MTTHLRLCIVSMLTLALTACGGDGADDNSGGSAGAGGNAAGGAGGSTAAGGTNDGGAPESGSDGASVDGSGTGDTCMDLLSCVQGCALQDYPCGTACYEKASPEAMDLFNARDACMRDKCESWVTDQACGPCLQQECAAAHLACEAQGGGSGGCVELGAIRCVDLDMCTNAATFFFCPDDGGGPTPGGETLGEALSACSSTDSPLMAACSLGRPCQAGPVVCDTCREVQFEISQCPTSGMHTATSAGLCPAGVDGYCCFDCNSPTMYHDGEVLALNAHTPACEASLDEFKETCRDWSHATHFINCVAPGLWQVETL